MANRTRIDVESIERALNNGMQKGWVARWERHIEGGHVVDIPRWGPERFKTNRETYAFAIGLAAAGRNHIPAGPISSKDAAEMIYAFTAEVHAAMADSNQDGESA